MKKLVLMCIAVVASVCAGSVVAKGQNVQLLYDTERD